jgi:hypothetical protein
MQNRFIVTLFILFTLPIIYSQDSFTIKNKHNSLQNSNDKKSLKIKKESSDAIFVSLKGGYHTINWDYDGLKSSWIAGLSLGAVINKHWCLGIAFDYSTSNNANYHDDGSEIIYDKNYKEYGVSMICKYKYYFLKDKIDINAGIGLGTYNINTNNWEGYYSGDGYLNAGVNAGIGFKILRNLSIDLEWSLCHLLIMKEGRRHLIINNFKLGPTIYLYY